ncbi:hypothetical protein ACFQZZ_31230 [Nocardia sp. GCM10030253]|uniref:hypothetical protein n=1 Tax=Nocardia sp. GCM10030253 TaxID=3273404 RepID=UPI003624ED10
MNSDAPTPSTALAAEARAQCHLRIRFPNLDRPLDFQCERTAGEQFAAILTANRSDLDIVIDADVRPDMALLPCAALWRL